MSKLLKDFTETMELVGRKHGLSQVFNDLLTAGICSFHTTNIKSQLQEKDEANEELYLETIKKYSKEELAKLAELLGILQLNVLENPYSDILGEYFTIHITKGQNGQFFTPDPISEFMASILAVDEEEGLWVSDPACGSGRMSLNAAKKNPRNFFFAADNDLCCARMACVNFFLNGLKGEVSCMNSLSLEWYQAWHINLDGIGIKPIEKEQSLFWQKQSESTLKEHSENKQNSQLSLFKKGLPNDLY